MEHLLHWLWNRNLRSGACSCYKLFVIKKMKNFSICLGSKVGNQVSAKDIILI